MTATVGGASAATPVEADDVAAAVLACPSVVGLHGGGPRAVATLLPGRRVDGVRFTDDAIEISVAGLLGVPIGVVATEIRGALAGLAQGRTVHVHIADVRERDEPPQNPASPSSGLPA
jgi:hypothetical protein